MQRSLPVRSTSLSCDNDCSDGIRLCHPKAPSSLSADRNVAQHVISEGAGVRAMDIGKTVPCTHLTNQVSEAALGLLQLQQASEHRQHQGSSLVNQWVVVVVGAGQSQSGGWRAVLCECTSQAEKL